MVSISLLRQTIAVAGFAGAFWFGDAIGLRPASADTVSVDLELVLAVDVSLSMDPDEQKLQRDGYVEALKDPEVIAAIRANALGRIGVVYVEWAGNGTHKVTVPWSLVDGALAAAAFADRLAEAPIMRAQKTSISGALKFAGGLFDVSGFAGKRRVIDVSGDGPNNDGSPVTQARDALVAKGIVINGLPIMIKAATGWFDLADLDRYYEECVTGGFGSFVVTVRQKNELARAIKRKLLLEIAERPSLPLVRIQAGPDVPMPPGAPRDNGDDDRSDRNPMGRVDCLIGEKRWQQYMGGRRGTF